MSLDFGGCDIVVGVQDMTEPGVARTPQVRCSATECRQTAISNITPERELL